MRLIIPAMALLVSACAHESATTSPELVFSARVRFVQADFRTERLALPVGSFYLSFPFIGGNLYGEPTTRNFIKPAMAENYSFSMNLLEGLGNVKASVQTSRLATSPGLSRLDGNGDGVPCEVLCR